MKNIQITAKFKIHQGKIVEFKNMADKVITAVLEKEKGVGALQYDWFFSPDQSEYVVLENYVDSNAVLTHLGNVGETLGQMLTISDLSLELYGNLSEELQNAVVALSPQIYSFYKGL